MDDERSDGLDQPVDVELTLPLRQLIKLHSVRALSGRELGAVVADALDEHLDELPGTGDRASGDLDVSR